MGDWVSVSDSGTLLKTTNSERSRIMNLLCGQLGKECANSLGTNIMGMASFFFE